MFALLLNEQSLRALYASMFSPMLQPLRASLPLTNRVITIYRRNYMYVT